jgi:serine/threonine protein kinase
MELVRGIPITKYCDENHLTPTARLEVFIKVCQAVQHAHHKGIIHRDLKPSNILLTVNDGAPTPKVIDFGTAKATQGRLTDATVYTALEQFIGTPVYMSPEQAEMSSLEIDTRSDIYSLGVLLYELLTGKPPFDPKVFAQAGVDARHRIILWDVETRKVIREISLAAECGGLFFSDDSRTLAAATLFPDDKIIQWSVANGSVLSTVSTRQGRRFAAAPDLSAAAHVTSSGQLRVVDLNSGLEHWVAAGADEGSIVGAIAFSADGRLIASSAGAMEVFRSNSAR